MSAISDYAAAQAPINAAIDAALAQIQALIASIQAGSVSPADQASLDALSAHNQNLSNQLQALQAQLQPPAQPAA